MDANVAAVRFRQSGNESQQRCLSSPVRSDQSQRLPLFDAQTDTMDRDKIVEGLGDVINFNYRVGQAGTSKTANAGLRRLDVAYVETTLKSTRELFFNDKITVGRLLFLQVPDSAGRLSFLQWANTSTTRKRVN
jgi:hypothetical protein